VIVAEDAGEVGDGVIQRRVGGLVGVDRQRECRERRRIEQRLRSASARRWPTSIV
jgi:hypothetical protein